ncbi:ATP-binding protein [Pseudogracilibacillus sp. SE30717A]|uniref:sensor histidine kinase n=1 Tax=Pseudogracilibacillus sp. SE30717A TaxID=3098293 RepID=UPI00300E5F9F
MSKILQSIIVPKSFLWKLTLLNIFIIVGAILVSGWSIYHTACFLVNGMYDTSLSGQQYFNKTLFKYVLLYAAIAVLISSVVHFYFTKRLFKPIKNLIESTKTLKRGTYPKPLPEIYKDEIGQLIVNYNELTNQLKQNEQYRTKLIADISHELRTPISNLTGYLHALTFGDVTPSRELFEALHGQAKQLTVLIEQMRLLNDGNNATSKSRLKENIQLKTVIEESVKAFDWKIKQENIKILIDVEEAAVSIHPENMFQILNNLIDNAIRYFEGEGPICIHGEKKKLSYRVSVSNPGQAIEKEAQQYLFDRFYRVDLSRNRKTGGAGLGLAIVKELIANYDGEIEVQSKDGRNTFTLIFPIEDC